MALWQAAPSVVSRTDTICFARFVVADCIYFISFSVSGHSRCPDYLPPRIVCSVLNTIKLSLKLLVRQKTHGELSPDLLLPLQQLPALYFGFPMWNLSCWFTPTALIGLVLTQQAPKKLCNPAVGYLPSTAQQETTNRWTLWSISKVTDISLLIWRRPKNRGSEWKLM